MAFWSQEKLLEVLALGSLIPDHSTDRANVGAYELSMGREFFLTADAKGERQHTKQQLEAGEQLVIPQGQFALLITDERLNMPADAIGLISIKVGVKFRGLVNVSGFHVDAGFRGRLKFSVYNAGPQPIVISQGQPMFLIWFCDLDRPTTGNNLYAGEHQNQDSITPEDVMKITGDVASPAQLRKELEELRDSVKLYRNIALGVLTLIVIPLLRTLIEPYLKKDGSASVTYPPTINITVPVAPNVSPPTPSPSSPSPMNSAPPLAVPPSTPARSPIPSTNRP